MPLSKKDVPLYSSLTESEASLMAMNGTKEYFTLLIPER